MFLFFFFKQKTAYEMRISDWSSDVCSSDLIICTLLDELRTREDGKSYREQITYVTDRPGHDRRYAIDAGKIERELGWKPAETRSEERRVGKECVSTCRSRWLAYT